MDQSGGGRLVGVKSPLYDEVRTADNNRKDAQARFYDWAETYASILSSEKSN